MKAICTNLKRTIVLTAALVISAQNTLAKDWVYSVRQGDTLWGLCEKYTNRKDCWLKLGPYNQVDFPRTLAPGTRIRFPVSWLLEPPQPVEVIFTRGDVSTQTDEGARALAINDRLGIGSAIEVGAGSLAIVRFADGSLMTVEANSSLAFDRLSSFGESGMVDTKVNLQTGTVQTQVKKRRPRSHFEVQTPSAVAAVRGTEFRVAAEGESRTRSEVFDGEIKVANAAGEALVSRGQGLVAQKGKALPEVVTLPPAPELSVPDGPQALPYTLTWPSQQNVQAYRLRIVDDQGAHVRQQDISGQALVIDDLAEACYTFTLSALHSSGFQSLPEQASLCFLPALAAPTEVTGTRTDNSLALSWQPTQGAQSYRIDIAERADFSAGVESLMSSEAKLQIDTSSPKALYVRVAALGEGAIDSQPSAVIVTEPPEPKDDEPWLQRIIFGVMLAVVIAI